MTAALETTGLGRAFGDTWALRSCSLRVEPGTVTAVVGPNGAGKSTLLQLAAGLTTPTEGRVTVFGREPGGSPEALADVGYLAQDHPLYRSWRVDELLELGRATNPSWDAPLARRRLDDLGIPLRRRAGALSGGQQAQVALALALAKRPRLLLLDEPVASLDPLARRDFMAQVLSDVVEHGTTVVLSSHVIAELERVSDHLLVLGGGLVQVDGPIEDLRERHAVLVGVPELPVPAAVRQVVSETATARSRTLVVELSGPVDDPRWEVGTPSLEELALAYLSEPGAGTRSFTLHALGDAS
jgi:ABC-2 type transport system ATP-binding protein